MTTIAYLVGLYLGYKLGYLMGQKDTLPQLKELFKNIKEKLKL
jgi:hypothetical protein